MVEIEYRVGTANAKEVKTHLTLCNDSFHPPLNQKVDISEYAQKLIDNAVMFEAWALKRLVGLVAVYMNDIKVNTAFVSNVSMLNEYKGKGVATHLLEVCIDQAKAQHFKELALHVSEDNKRAMSLYSKLGFRVTDRKNKTVTMLKHLED